MKANRQEVEAAITENNKLEKGFKLSQEQLGKLHGITGPRISQIKKEMEKKAAADAAQTHVNDAGDDSSPSVVCPVVQANSEVNHV